MAHNSLTTAKKAKNDEFYTQYQDIEKEIASYIEYDCDVFRGKTVLCPCDDPEWSNFTKFFAQNFERFGLKKLISTSFAYDSKISKDGYQPTIFETSDIQFDKVKTTKNGKIFTLTRRGKKKLDVNDLKWKYLKGDGDFNSDEVKKLRNEADVIVTNPPFSLFRTFLPWIVEAGKKFVIIGNKNAIAWPQVFPLFMKNKMWVGSTSFSKDMLFISPVEIDPTEHSPSATRTVDGIVYLRSPSVWYTNIEHGRRHKPIELMTMKDNLKYSKHKEIIGKKSYEKYNNYDAIEVPFTNAIPSDYKGVMGVPMTFFDKFCPEQFDILGMCGNSNPYGLKTKVYSPEVCKATHFKKYKKKGSAALNASAVILRDDILSLTYQRVLIKHKKVKK